MGNIKSKNNLLTLLQKWEETSPQGNEYKSYSCKINDVTIHRLEGEYYVESSTATVGPMTKQQLLMLSQKNPNFRIKTTLCEQVTPEGDMLESSRLAESLITSIKKMPDQIDESNRLKSTKNIKNTARLPEINIQNAINNKFNIFIHHFGKKNSNAMKTFAKNHTTINGDGDILLRKVIEPKTKILTKYILKLKMEQKELTNELKLIRDEDEINGVGTKNLFKKTNDMEFNSFDKTLTHVPENKRNIKISQSGNKYNRYIIPANINYFNKKERFQEIKNEIPNHKSTRTIAKELKLTTKKTNLKPQWNKSFIDEYKNNLKLIQKIKGTSRLDPNQIDLLTKFNISCPSNSNVFNKPNIQTIGFSEPIANEKIRYTAFAKAENINWAKQKSLMRRLKQGFEERFACTVNLNDEIIEFRGNIIYTVNIEGKNKASVLKCLNSLPVELRANLILPRENYEESNRIVHEKWKFSKPYNPTFINVTGSKAIKLSY